MLEGALTAAVSAFGFSLRLVGAGTVNLSLEWKREEREKVHAGFEIAAAESGS